MNAPFALLAQGTPENVGLSSTGAAIMILSIALVIGLMVFCLRHILRESDPSQRHHAPLDVDTRDYET